MCIVKVFGDRGAACLARGEACCCGGHNPIGQAFFALIFSGCFLGVIFEVFPRLPGWHV